MSILNSINPIVDVLKNLSERGIKCNLLVGAGCSVTAGIPTANGIIDIIKEKFPSISSMIKEQTYANCMNALSPDERIDLIKGLVNQANLNITHIIIAELLKRGYIHRILTPNFDNLLIRACSVVNEYPPIYDLAAYAEFKPEHIPEKCIFYLHGQFTGFKLMNTNAEVTEQAEKLVGLFHRLNERSVWIIVGFSGLNDALFKLLSEENIYSNRLFWVGHNNQEPHKELKEKILTEGKYGFYVKGFDSDGFFWTLANQLNAFPPSFLLKPFSYIKNIIEQIVPYQPSKNLDLSTATNSIIQNAINKYENDPTFMADCYYNFGLYDNVISMEETLLKKKQNLTLANSYFYKAYELMKEAKNKKSVELFIQAIALNDRSNEIREYNGCLNNSGLAFYFIAQHDEEDRFEDNILEALRRYQLSIQMGNKEVAFRNTRDAIVLLLKNRSKNTVRIVEEMENKPFLIETIYQDLFDCCEIFNKNLVKIRIKNDNITKTVQSIGTLIEERIKKTLVKKSV